MSCQVISRHVTSFHVASCQVVLRHVEVISRCDGLLDVGSGGKTLGRVISHRVLLFHVTSGHFILCRIVSLCDGLFRIISLCIGSVGVARIMRRAWG